MNTDISLLVNDYIVAQKLAWARTSQKNERARLNKHAKNIFRNPVEVYTELINEGMKPYSIKTTLTRLGCLYAWAMENEKIPLTTKNPWKSFMESHAMLFKHAYQTERLTVTYQEAEERIMTMEEPFRSAALQLLRGGLRYCELRTYDGQKVIGKGSKPRDVYIKAPLDTFRYTGSYTALFIRLKMIGLKPHTLRKLFATEFSQQPGVTDIDIMEVCGWNDIGTSAKYRQPKRRERLSELVSKTTGEF